MVRLSVAGRLRPVILAACKCNHRKIEINEINILTPFPACCVRQARIFHLPMLEIPR
jgi:hypothetical protein